MVHHSNNRKAIPLPTVHSSGKSTVFPILSITSLSISVFFY